MATTYKPVELTEEKRAELDEEHGDILVLKGTPRAPWVMAVRRPTRQETIGFKRAAKTDPTTANEQFIRRIALFPEAKSSEFDGQLERWPLFCDAIANSEAFNDFLGLSVSEDLKG